MYPGISWEGVFSAWCIPHTDSFVFRSTVFSHILYCESLDGVELCILEYNGIQQNVFGKVYFGKMYLGICIREEKEVHPCQGPFF